jgi:hypothetical protein
MARGKQVVVRDARRDPPYPRDTPGGRPSLELIVTEDESRELAMKVKDVVRELNTLLNRFDSNSTVSLVFEATSFTANGFQRQELHWPRHARLTAQITRTVKW